MTELYEEWARLNPWTEPCISSYKTCTVPPSFGALVLPGNPGQTRQHNFHCFFHDRPCLSFFLSLLLKSQRNFFLPDFSNLFPVVSPFLPASPLPSSTRDCSLCQGRHRSSGFPLSISLWTWHCSWPLLSLCFEVLFLLSALPLDCVNPPPFPAPSVGFNKREELTGTSSFVLSACFHFS